MLLTRRELAAPLYEDRKTLRAVVEAALEGNGGKIEADDPRSPRVARIDFGCYSIFGGDPDHPAMKDLLTSVQAPIELLFPEAGSHRWRDVIHEVHGDSARDRPMTAFGSEAVDLVELRQAASQIVEGYEILPMGLAEAAQLDESLTPHALQAIESPDVLVAEGFGYCALRDGKVACQSTSYAWSSRHVEQAISTHPEHRKLGLARVVAARFMLHAIECRITPHWNASNPISKRLALSLGYREAGTCEVLYVE